MCFNAEVSITLFIASLLAAAYIYSKSGRMTALLIVLIGSMQLLDFFLWLDQDCGHMNRNTSYAVIWLLWLHGSALITAAYFIWPDSRHITRVTAVAAALLLATSTCACAIWTRYCTQKPEVLCSLQDPKSNRLTWKAVAILFDNALLAAVCSVCYLGLHVLASYVGDYNAWAFPLWKFFLVLFGSLGTAFLFNPDKAMEIFSTWWCTLATVANVLGVMVFAWWPPTTQPTARDKRLHLLL